MEAPSEMEICETLTSMNADNRSQGRNALTTTQMPAYFNGNLANNGRGGNGVGNYMNGLNGAMMNGREMNMANTMVNSMGNNNMGNTMAATNTRSSFSGMSYGNGVHSGSSSSSGMSSLDTSSDSSLRGSMDWTMFPHMPQRGNSFSDPGGHTPNLQGSGSEYVVNHRSSIVPKNKRASPQFGADADNTLPSLRSILPAECWDGRTEGNGGSPSNVPQQQNMGMQQEGFRRGARIGFTSSAGSLGGGMRVNEFQQHHPSAQLGNYSLHNSAQMYQPPQHQHWGNRSAELSVPQYNNEYLMYSGHLPMPNHGPGVRSLHTSGDGQQSNSRRCTACKTDTTPRWRRGPHGRQTLCNSCGLRYIRLRKKETEDGAAAGK